MATAAIIVGTAASVMGSLSAASGAKAAGKQALRTAQYNKEIRDRNARVADLEADYRDRVTERQEVRARGDCEEFQAQNRVARAKSGVVTTSGSPLLVLRDSANEFAEDMALLHEQGATESGRMREQAVGQRLSGSLALLEGQSRKMAEDIRAKGHAFAALKGIGTGMYQYSQIR